MTVVTQSIPSGPTTSGLPSGPYLNALSVGDTAGLGTPSVVSSIGTENQAIVGLSSPSSALVLVVKTVVVTDSYLDLDVSNVNTIVVDLQASVSSISIEGWPASGFSQRVTVYLDQDSTGGRTVSGWPVAVQWAGGVAPVLDTSPNSRACVVLDSTDGGSTVQASLVSLTYVHP